MYFATGNRPANGDRPRKQLPVKDMETKRNPAALESKYRQKYTFLVEHQDYSMMFSCASNAQRDKWVSALQEGFAAADETKNRSVWWCGGGEGGGGGKGECRTGGKGWAHKTPTPFPSTGARA